MKSKYFGTLDNDDVTLYTIENDSVSCDITDYGATLTSLRVKDTDSAYRDIILGYDTLEGYLNGSSFFGATIGRYANRIGGASFTIGGNRYQLTANEGDNTLHAGNNGFDKALWKVVQSSTHSITLEHTDDNGNDGFPGTIQTMLTISIIENSLIFEYDAVSDLPTHISLTNHAYYNLDGAGEGDVTGHLFSITADSYTDVDDKNIPTGKTPDVTGSFYDLRDETVLSERKKEYPEKFFDINYCLEKRSRPAHVCSAYSPNSGIRMDLATTEPGVQFYTGAKIGAEQGKNGQIYGAHAGFCFEPQHWPDTPNNPSFPSTLIQPNEHYSQKSILTFSTV